MQTMVRCFFMDNFVEKAHYSDLFASESDCWGWVEGMGNIGYKKDKRMAVVPLYVEGIFGIVVGRGADSFVPSFYFVASEIDSYFKVLHIFSYKYLTPFLAFKFHDRANPLIRYDYDLQQTIDWERTHQIMLPLCPSSPHQIYYLGLYSNSEQFYLRCYWQVGQKTQSTTVPP